MTGTTTLRVTARTRDRIKRLAEEDHLSAGDLLERLVEKEEQERTLREMNEDFSQLHQDPELWGAFRSETEAWDTTSADGGAPSASPG